MKTTPWFKAGNQNPVRVGAYEVHDEMFKYWDGRRWGYYSASPLSAYFHRCLSNRANPDQTGFKWRGLLKESK